MATTTLLAVLRLSRAPSCAVAFLTAFVPVIGHTGNFVASLAVALPVPIICMCIFILNDLNDLEADRINHPGRPLPSRLISSRTARLMCMASFASVLGTVWFFTDPSFYYWYFLLLLLGLNYNTVVNYIPIVKTIYVSLTIVLALVFVGKLVDSQPDVKLLGCAFLFILGRELLMDVDDLQGDGSTFAKWATGTKTTILAFALQGISAIILIALARSALQIGAASAIATLLLLILIRWWVEERHSRLFRLMHLQMLSGISFLV